MTTHPADALFHRLWSKAVGSADYDKGEWQKLSKFIVEHCYGPKSGTTGQRRQNAKVPLYEIDQ